MRVGVVKSGSVEKDTRQREEMKPIFKFRTLAPLKINRYLSFM